MKQKDIVLIIVIVFISAIMSFMISKYFIATPENRQQQVEVVQAIKSEFGEPDKKYFNDQSIDPTQLIKITENANPNPFSTKAGQ